MLSTAYLVVTYKWKFLPFITFIQFPLPRPLSLVTTNLISSSLSLFFFFFFCLFEVQLTYNTILVPSKQYTDLVFIYIKNDPTINLVTICHNAKILHNN